MIYGYCPDVGVEGPLGPRKTRATSKTPKMKRVIRTRKHGRKAQQQDSCNQYIISVGTVTT